MSAIKLSVNGTQRTADVEPRRTLADVLRDAWGLCGSHLGCEHGVCGACTVLLDGEPIRACLIFAIQADGRAVRTVEGLERDGALHPMQRAFIDNHAIQCGFCTPGFLMLAIGALERRPDLSAEEIRTLLSSNLCRCTGYESIERAVLEGARAMRAVAPPNA